MGVLWWISLVFQGIQMKSIFSYIFWEAKTCTVFRIELGKENLIWRKSLLRGCTQFNGCDVQQRCFKEQCSLW